MRISVLTVLTVCAVVALCTAGMAADIVHDELTNGNFEGAWVDFSIGEAWSSYNVGSGWVFMPNYVNYRETGAQQAKRGSASGQFGGVRQVVSSRPGDAFTLGDAWVYSISNSNLNQATVRALWDGAPWIPGGSQLTDATIWATAAQPAKTWYQITSHPGGNATGSSVMFILDSRVAGTGTTTIDITWDDFAVYHAYVPATPIVGSPTASSLNVNVDPGIYSKNANAQYAITIGGGGYTLGTNWLKANGTVGAAAAWQTDDVWGDLTVGGLTASTGYTFQVKSRYNEIYSQNTYLGTGGEGTTTAVPEPGSMIALMSGLVGLVGFGIRRRK